MATELLDKVVRVPVALGERSYDILIGDGLIATAGARIAALLPGSRVAVVTDRTVGTHYLEPLTAGLDAAGVGHVTVTVPPGEGSKSFTMLERVVDGVLAGRLERGDAVVALGGGVVGDLAGFVSGLIRRGMHLIQMPTSLLAQVDSSVGGKTGINTPRGKNLVGVFQQPDLVLADTGSLDTLSPREFAAGYAEVAKYGLLGDAGFFAWLENNHAAVFGGGEARVHAIAVSCRAKARIVEIDERETGDRQLLNLGHTIGHALEAAAGYSDRLIHGEAIAIGMALAHRLSARLGYCGDDTWRRVEAHLAAVGLPIAPQQIPGGPPDAATLMELIAQDKKVKRGRLTFILSRGIGQSFIAGDVPADEVLAFLEERLAAGAGGR